MKVLHEIVPKSNMRDWTFALPSDDLVYNILESEFFIQRATRNCNENTPANQNHPKESTNVKENNQ